VAGAKCGLASGVPMTKEEETQGFRVTDKRKFAEGGQPSEDASNTVEPPRDSGPEPVQDDLNTPLGEIPGADARIDFPSYILSYYTQGLVLLGEVVNPYTNKKEEDLQAARHTVDILAMLEEKTKGNLSKEEDQLLGSVLYELRMKFMSKTSRIKL